MDILATYYELASPEQLEIKTKSLDAQSLSGTQVAARTLFTAISPGTELSAFLGMPPLRPRPAYPRLLGYCSVAEVIAVGHSVKALSVGDLIATHQSHRSAFVSDTTDILAVLPVNADPRHASVTYLFHLGYSALLRAQYHAGHRIGVIGLGAIGLASVAVAAHSGTEVYGFSNYCSQETGADFGARAVFPKSPSDEVLRQLDDLELDIVVTTSNTWADWELALKLTRRGGTIAVIGFPGRGQAPAPFNPLASQYFYDKQLAILGCGQTPDIDCANSIYRFSLKRNFRYLLALVTEKKLPAEKLIAGIVPSSALEVAYKRLQQHRSKGVTYVLDWTE